VVNLELARIVVQEYRAPQGAVQSSVVVLYELIDTSCSIISFSSTAPFVQKVCNARLRLTASEPPMSG